MSLDSRRWSVLKFYPWWSGFQLPSSLHIFVATTKLMPSWLPLPWHWLLSSLFFHSAVPLPCTPSIGLHTFFHGPPDIHSPMQLSGQSTPVSLCFLILVGRLVFLSSLLLGGKISFFSKSTRSSQSLAMLNMPSLHFWVVSVVSFHSWQWSEGVLTVCGLSLCV